MSRDSLMRSTALRLALVLVAVVGWAIPLGARAADVYVNADCHVQFNLPGSTPSNTPCVGLPGTAVSGPFNRAELVQAADGSIQAQWAAAYTDFGHLGGLVQTFAEHVNTNVFNSNISADASLGIAYRDLITITSSTLAVGTPVPFAVSFNVTGNMGAQSGNPAYYSQIAASGIQASMAIGYPENLATVVGPYAEGFCVRSFSSVGCATLPGNAGVGTFEYSHDTNVMLAVGITYQLDARISLQSVVGLNLFQTCEFNSCDAGAYVDSSHSFTSFLTPVGAGYQVVAQSGHDYSMPAPALAVPEPSTYLLLSAGILIFIFRFGRRPTARWRRY